MARNKWNEVEIKVIEDNYQKLSDNELSKLIPNHSECSIACKRKEMGLVRPSWNKKYTFDDVLYYINKKNYILISDKKDFNNAGSQIKYLCPKHKDKGVQVTTLGRLLEGKGCKFCGIEKTAQSRRKDFDEEYNKSICNDFNYTYVRTRREIVPPKNHNIIFIDFICNVHREYGIQTTRQNNLRKGSSACMYCHHKNLPKDYILQLIEEKAPNIEILDNDFYKLTDKVKCKCKVHNHISRQSIQDILKGKYCYYCGIDKLSKKSFLSIEEINHRIKETNPHLELIEDYHGIQKSHKFRCNKCGYIWKANINTVNYCPHCEKYYKGEKIIEEILMSLNIDFEMQKRFDNCRDKRCLPFDFYLPNNNLCIEYQGRQHYIPIDYFGGEDAFKTLQFHDTIKRNFCRNSNIKLLEIPYQYDTKEKIMDLIKQKL